MNTPTRLPPPSSMTFLLHRCTIVTPPPPSPCPASCQPSSSFASAVAHLLIVVFCHCCQRHCCPSAINRSCLSDAQPLHLFSCRCPPPHPTIVASPLLCIPLLPLHYHSCFSIFICHVLFIGVPHLCTKTNTASFLLQTARHYNCHCLFIHTPQISTISTF
jgi:hypothetical protein